jgi:hypothetical protein
MRIARFRVAGWSLGGALVGLLGCPQLLEDSFSTARLSKPDAGGVCQDGECGVPPAGGAARDAGRAGSTGSSGAGGAGAGGGAGSGNSGSSGTAAGAGGAGSAGAGGSADAGGSAGDGGSAGSGLLSACRTIELTDTTHDSASNCVGIVGWNDVTKDNGTTLSLSYDNGDPCFTGTIAASGWGAVYDLTFANPDNATWNATSHGVTGFDFVSRGARPPASYKVLYKDPSGVDFCRVIAPGDVEVPFSEAHEDCSSNVSSPIVDRTRMVAIILAFVPKNRQAYPVDFCLQISALD